MGLPRANPYFFQESRTQLVDGVSSLKKAEHAFNLFNLFKTNFELITKGHLEYGQSANNLYQGLTQSVIM